MTAFTPYLQLVLAAAKRVDGALKVKLAGFFPASLKVFFLDVSSTTKHLLLRLFE
jgi:hypothetical protein